jgi:hypothetical protein
LTSYGHGKLLRVTSFDLRQQTGITLHCCRPGDGLRTAILHLTIDGDVERYLIEQSLKPQVIEAEISSRV